MCGKVNKVTMQGCCCMISLAPHFTFLWEGDMLELETALTALSAQVVIWETEKRKSLCR